MHRIITCVSARLSLRFISLLCLGTAMAVAMACSGNVGVKCYSQRGALSTMSQRMGLGRLHLQTRGRATRSNPWRSVPSGSTSGDQTR
jgi:hypothetical protein